jgi:hypothetical protein
MEYEINFNAALKDPKEIKLRVEKINKIAVEMASSYYIEKANKKSRCVK